MNKEFWIILAIQIAMLIATSLNPFVQVWYQNRSNRRIAASPDKNQPKANIEPPLARWLLRLMPLVSSSVGIAVSVWSLAKELGNQEPPNRVTVVVLALDVTVVFAVLIVLFVTDLMARFILALQESQTLSGRLVNDHGRALDILKEIASKPRSKRRDTLD